MSGVTFQMMPYYGDQRTDNTPGTNCTDCGIFTVTTGTAPNRIFTVEYRTIYFSQTNTTHTLDYEVNLYESGAPAFDFNFLTIVPFNLASRILSVGVQQDSTTFTQVGCDTSGFHQPTRSQRPALRVGCGTLRFAYADAYTHGGSNRYRYSHSHSYGDGHIYAYGDCHIYSHATATFTAHFNCNSYGNIHATLTRRRPALPRRLQLHDHYRLISGRHHQPGHQLRRLLSLRSHSHSRQNL